MRSSSRQLGYWTCQLLGWGAYGLLNFALLSAQGAGFAAWSFAWSGLGLVFTHGLRAQARRRGWERLALGALVPRVVVAAVLLSVATNALSLGTLWAVGVLPREVPFQVLAILTFNWSAVYLGWQLIYFAVHWLERSRRAELEELQSRAAAQDAELRALKAQLNPHFLFNALNSIRALISLDPPRAQALVTELAGLLRYAIGSGGAQLVPLERELAVTRGYLSLESARLDARLRVRIDVSDDCLRAPVPALLVQGLVENGIKHGVARLAEGGEISLSARMHAGQLRLEVQNPTAPAAAPKAPGAGVGLQNARERLRLLFGNLATLELDEASPGLFVARLSISGAP